MGCKKLLLRKMKLDIRTSRCIITVRRHRTPHYKSKIIIMKKRILGLFLASTFTLAFSGCATHQSSSTSPADELRGKGLTNGEFTVQINGIKMWYKVSGTGPVCLMPSPAWGMSSDLYIKTLKPMEKIFTMVYLDSRACGRSDQ